MLEVKNLSKQFGEVMALDQVSFTIGQGESVGLVGESGSGKTTLARIVLGLLKPTSGEVLYQGKSLLAGGFAFSLRQQLQIVFQDPQDSLNSRMRVGEILAEPLIIHKLCKDRRAVKQRVEELLEKVGLNSSYARRYPHQLSGGERQRIGIGRALSLNPQFMVLDEPVSALDVTVQAQILGLLRQLKTSVGLTYLFIAHDLAIVGQMCERVLVMEKGRLVEQGEVGGVFANPQYPYTKKLLSSCLAIDF